MVADLESQNKTLEDRVSGLEFDMKTLRTHLQTRNKTLEDNVSKLKAQLAEKTMEVDTLFNMLQKACDPVPELVPGGQDSDSDSDS